MPRRNQRPIHTPFHFVSNCQSKKRFATKKQAQDVAEHQMLIDMDLELSVYKCDICGGWHLTRQTHQ